MTRIFEIPVGAVGPGTQPTEEDGAQLDIMSMPSEMNTFSLPTIPEPEEVQGLDTGMALLETLLLRLGAAAASAETAALSLDALDADNRKLVDQVLGEGEVSAVIQGEPQVKIQESVLAGVWRVQREDEAGQIVADSIEVGEIPHAVRLAAEEGLATSLQPGEVPDGVINALPLVAELNERLAAGVKHTINLTLLPQSEADLAYLDRVLGTGRATVLSRGYGNCRITSTATRGVWWVQYFNSQDAMILNTLEVTDVPSVACASAEDLEDSAARLEEILEVYR